MGWFNIYGFIVIAVMMIPNIVYAIKCKEGFNNCWNNRVVEVLEQIGRFGCFGFMIFNIPGTYLGWMFKDALTIYLVVNNILLFLYCFLWIIYFKKNNLTRALTLSIIPSLVFLFSGIMLQSILLIISIVLFAPCHILISVKNTK